MSLSARPCLWLAVPAVLLWLGLPAPARGQEAPPLPDAETFLAEVRKHLRTDALLLADYTYTERRREVNVSALGKVSDGPEKVYAVTPSDDPELPVKRLVSVDGAPPTKDDLEKHEDDQREAARRAHERRREPDARRREQERVEEMLSLYEFEILAREIVDGHATIVIAFEPREDVKPRTDEGKILKKARGRAWVSETEHQIVKVEANTIEDITIGWGLIGRLYKGSHLSVLRDRLADGTWLPKLRRFTGRGKTLLFRSFEIETLTEYSDFQRHEAAPAGVSGDRQR